MFTRSLALPVVVALFLASGCGSSSRSQSSSGTAAAGGGAGAAERGSVLAADAKSAATGDIPDTQNFLTFRAPLLHVSMLYPEGWTIKETASQASITDKNNLVRISVSSGPAPTVASVQTQLAGLKATAPSLTAGTPHVMRLRSGSAVKVTYRTQSAPNAVTGKRVALAVDRYALAHGGRVAIVDLGTPVGVDNVDAYKRMIESFKWR